MGREIDLSVIPSAVFTSPEVAMVGKTEKQALESGHDIAVGKAMFRSNGKAQAMGEPDGLVKVIVDRDNDLLLGAFIVGPHAADLIEEGDTIGLDSGSTANPFAEILAGRFEKLTVVTFSLDIVRILGDKPGVTILVPGGCYLSGERIISGFMAEQGLGRFHVEKSFIFPSSFSVTHGIGMFKPEFYPLERALMSIAEQKIFIGDSSKFGVVAPIRLCDAGEADVIVSDSGLDEKTADEFRAAGVRVINSPLHKNETETH